MTLGAVCRVSEMVIMNTITLSSLSPSKGLFSPYLSVSIFIIVFTIPSASPLTLDFPSFDADSGDLLLQGDAFYSGGNIELTQGDDSKNGSVGRAVFPKSLPIWDNTSQSVADFNTTFSFIIYSENKSHYGEGLSFFLGHTGLPIPEPQQEGSSLGLVGGTQAYPFVSVEFDTSQNSDANPGYDHIGININSVSSVHYVRLNSCIVDGEENDAWISYDSATHNLSVSFSGYCNNSKIQRLLYYHVDLKTVLPELVSFGFSAATGPYLERHTITSWSFYSSLTVGDGKSTNKGLVVALGVGVGASVLVFGLWLIWYIFKKQGSKPEESDEAPFDLPIDDELEMGSVPRKFSFDELARATRNFSEEEKLGQGGFGGVYRGFLRELNCNVAVKRVSKGSRQGIKEYASEVKIISKLRHKNLVKLIGWCHERRGLLLVYEFMANGSLDFHLFKEKSLLTWNQRYRIVQGLAAALLYLHEDWEQCVVHRDIKSSNIMLDSNFNAKLGDFGLARLVDHEKGSQTTVLAGTWGYMAPECATTGKASKESDVYSFGVVALEIACGRKPIMSNVEENQRVLVEWVWELFGNGKLVEAADTRLCGEFDEQQMAQLMIVGLWCAHPDYNTRPSIRQAMQVLYSESPLPDLPSKMPVPTYVALPAVNTHSSSSVSVSSSLSFSSTLAR